MTNIAYGTKSEAIYIVCVGIDQWFSISRILLMNAAIDSTHCECETNAQCDEPRIWSKATINQRQIMRKYDNPLKIYAYDSKFS